MAELAECEAEYSRLHQECTKYVCTYNDLQGRDLHGPSSWPAYADAERCYVGYKESPRPPRVHETYDPEPTVYDGTPVCAQMQSFPQRAEDCVWPRDTGNARIKQRLLQYSSGPTEIMPRPRLKPCGTTGVELTRQGTVASIEGLVQTAKNLRDANAESDLRLLDRKLTSHDDAGYLIGGGQAVCAEPQVREARRTPRPRLLEFYQSMKIDADVYDKSARGRPYAFNNLTKAKNLAVMHSKVAVPASAV